MCIHGHDCAAFFDQCFDSTASKTESTLIQISNDLPLRLTKKWKLIVDESILKYYKISLPEAIIDLIQSFAAQTKYVINPMFEYIRQSYCNVQICDRWYQDHGHNPYVRVVFTGKPNCGQTSIIGTFVEHKFAIAYHATKWPCETFEESFCKTTTLLNDKTFTFDILDVENGVDSSEEYRVDYQEWLKQARLVVYIFSYPRHKKEHSNSKLRSNEKGMECLDVNININQDLEQWYDEMLKESKKYSWKSFERDEDKFGLILCATKVDLEHLDYANDSDERTKYLKQIIQFAKQHNVPFIEVSALCELHINKLFDLMALEYWYTDCVTRCPYV